MSELPQQGVKLFNNIAITIPIKRQRITINTSPCGIIYLALPKRKKRRKGLKIEEKMMKGILER